MTSRMALFCASLLFKIAIAMPGAMPWLGPMPTPIGLMATAGMSPRPTEAPVLDGIPQELRRRQNVLYPPPANWCGFVSGNYDEPLTCSVGLTCVNSMAALGCCTATTGICTALYTTCLNYGDTCGRACQLDPAIRKCSDAELPYCGTYAFPGDASLFNCDVTSAPVYPLEFLNDYYITAIGSTIASESASASLGAAETAASASATGSGFFTGTISSFGAGPTDNTYSGSSYNYNSGSSGLPIAAIDGIAAGVSILGVAIIGAIIFFCARSRKRKRIAAASRPNIPIPLPPSMQMSPPQYEPPKTFDGYQGVPQQEQQQQQQQYPQYASFQPSQTAYASPPGPPSTLSPQTTGNPDPRFSTANTSFITPQSPETDGRQSYYKPPLSPEIREVDGTMGNPGVPNGGHGLPYQMMPGGSPSATEIEGLGRDGHQAGPYELGHEGR